MGMLGKMKAAMLTSKGSSLREKGRLDEAEATFRKAIEADASSADAWHNLGLLYKYQGRWPESMECQGKAVELDPEDESWWWDLGIAATGAGDWSAARQAWKRCGVEIPAAEGEVEKDMGPAAVRVKGTAEVPEVIWAQRVDPARAELQGVPLPTTERRWKDVVIHEGVPNGSRGRSGKQFHVFDELRLFKPSGFKTYRVVSSIKPKEAGPALLESFQEAGLAASDWQSSVRFLCEICLTGVPHKVHSHEVHGGERIYGAAANSEDEVREIVSAWNEKWPECEVVGIDLVYGG